MAQSVGIFDHTDERNAVRLTALVAHRKVQVCQVEKVNNTVKGVGLQCLRDGCMRQFDACKNKKDAYLSVLGHVGMHNWNAGAIMDEAVRALHEDKDRLVKASPSKRSKQWHQTGEGQLISPPKGKSSKRPSRTNSTTSLPERSYTNTCSDRIKIVTQLAITIAALNLPLSIVDRSTWRQFMEIIGCPFNLTRADVCEAMQEVETSVMQSVVVRLVAPDVYASLAVDAVTNINHDKIYSFILICRGRAHYRHSENIGSAPDTAEAAAAMITNVVNKLRVHGVRVTSLVTDNASNMTSARKYVANSCHILPVSCGAHLIHNCAMYLIDNKQINVLIAAFNHIIHKYTTDKSVRQSFANTGTRRLKRTNDTRWSSHLFAYQRLVDERSKIADAAHQSSTPIDCNAIT